MAGFQKRHTRRATSVQAPTGGGRGASGVATLGLACVPVENLSLGRVGIAWEVYSDPAQDLVGCVCVRKESQGFQHQNLEEAA